MDQSPDSQKKRGRGRPKGSLNKKTLQKIASEPAKSVAIKVPATSAAAAIAKPIITETDEIEIQPIISEPEAIVTDEPVEPTVDAESFDDAPEIESVADLGPSVELDTEPDPEPTPEPDDELENEIETVPEAADAELTDIWGDAPTVPAKSSAWEPLRPSRKARVKTRRLSLDRSLLKSAPIWIGLGSIVAGLLFVGIASALHKPETKKVASDDLVVTVGKLVVLPTDETPIVKTVIDDSKVNQPFLQHALNGDRILIYSKSNRVIIYRPSENKIVDIGTVTINANATATPPPPAEVTPPPAAPTTASVALWNGGTTVGITSVYEQSLPKSVTGLTISEKQQAVGQNYAQTIVVSLTDKADKAKEIAAALHATVGSLPAGEVKPNADVLVIFGKDIKQ